MSIQQIFVLYKREFKKIYRSKYTIFMLLIQPLMWLVFFGSSLGRLPKALTQELFKTSNYLSFILPGVLSLVMLFVGMFASMSLIQDKRYGYLRRIMVAPVNGEVPLFSKLLGGLTRGLIEVPIVLIIGIAMGASINFSLTSVLIMIASVVLLGITFSSVFLLLTLKTSDLQAPGVISSLILFPLMFSSTAIFPSNLFPSWLELLSKFNPLTYSVDLIRNAFLGYSFNLNYLIFLLGYAIIFLFLDFILGRKYLSSE
ncbi:MAG: ABC transporter permease [Candidatus Parvarchaeota archaeon]|nr:ABC transporter permease [Candidatus Rehaiarchaeum fermentans]